jgi:hypothetical protein
MKQVREFRVCEGEVRCLCGRRRGDSRSGFVCKSEGKERRERRERRQVVVQYVLVHRQEVIESAENKSACTSPLYLSLYSKGMHRCHRR